MLIDERFILLFLVLYFNRAIAFDGNNFQWKINVAVQTIPHLLSSATCSLLSTFCFLLCSAVCSVFRLLCSDFCFLLSASCSALLMLSFFSLFIFSNVPAALPSVCSALPALLFSSGSALLDGGAYHFSKK